MENDPGDLGQKLALPRAEVLRAEIDDAKKKAQEDSFNRQMQKVIAEIIKNKSKGRLVWVQSVSDEVVKELIKYGYKVQFNRAAHSGGIDTHTISW